MSQIFWYMGYWIFVIARLLTLFLFSVSPLLGWATAFLLDWFDFEFALRGGVSWKRYQTVDKVTDLIIRTYMLWAVVHFAWEHAFVFALLFAFRLIGDIIYFLTRRDIYYFFFPNIFDFFFPLYAIYISLSWDKSSLPVLFLIATIGKYIHEYINHVAKVTDPLAAAYIKKHPKYKNKIRQE